MSNEGPRVYQFEKIKLHDYREAIAECLRTEHWPEVGHFKDQPIDMDWKRYDNLDRLDKLRCYMVQGPINEDIGQNVLMGYAFFIVDHHLHYQTVKVANQDILYIRKQFRGIGRTFIDWCDTQLAKEGVVTVTHHVKPYMNWSKILDEMGYEHAELIYARRLDKWVSR